MELWQIILLIVLGLHPLSFAILGMLAGLPRRLRHISPPPQSITVVIKARDEEGNISRSLKSFISLPEFPQTQLILVDDGSRDGTRQIMQKISERPNVTIVALHHDWTPVEQREKDLQLAESNPRFFVHDAAQFLPELLGRQRAVAAAMRHVQTDAVLLSDADCTFHPGWIKSHLEMLETADLACGYVNFCPFPRRLFDRIVANESLLLQAASAAAFRLGRPGGAMGGNLAFHHSAYVEAGGYEHLGPTNTEDAQLTMAIVRRHRVAYNLEATAAVDHHDRLGALRFLRQRAFWLVGGAEATPFWMVVPWVLAADALAPWVALALAIGGLFPWQWVALGFIGRFLGDFICWLAMRRFDPGVKPWDLVLSWGYQAFYLTVLPFISLPGMIRALGRNKHH